MKVFWALIALMSVAAALVLMRRGSSDQASVPVADRPDAARVTAESPPVVPEAIVPKPIASEPVVADSAGEPELAIEPEPNLVIETQLVAAPDDAIGAPAPTTDQAPAVVEATAAGGPMPVPVAVTPEPAPEAAGGADVAPSVPDAPVDVATKDPAGDDPTPTRPRDPAHEMAREVAPAPEGHGLNPDAPPEERYKLVGQGTKEDPYEITWDILVSAADTYRPRRGQTELPEWVKSIDGKHVKIGGYLLFPLMSDSSDELLLTLNQWDGCCIGVPPTPYDAIEVRLTEVAEFDSWRVNYGTIEGTMKVDPYLVSNWLIGLYVMEDGVLTISQ